MAATTMAQGGKQPTGEAGQNLRVSQLFNFDWKFKLGETAHAESVDLDDSDWRSLDLPHDFQIEMPWNEKANRSRGFKDMATGWYRMCWPYTALPAKRRIHVGIPAAVCSAMSIWC